MGPRGIPKAEDIKFGYSFYFYFKYSLYKRQNLFLLQGKFLDLVSKMIYKSSQNLVAQNNNQHLLFHTF
jgi:hypothetical protein